MKNLAWLRRSSRKRFIHRAAHPLEPVTNSEVVEALLYLRRASELLNTSVSLDQARSRVDLAICELQEAIAIARQG